MKETYKDTTITYNESLNRWEFTLRGIERSAESLVKAREAIDKPPPKDKKPFTRIKAWFEGGYSFSDNGWHVVEVTSIVQSRYGHTAEAWVSDGKKRQREYITRIFPCNPKNDALIHASQLLQEQIDDLKKQQNKIEEKLKCLEAPEAEPNAAAQSMKALIKQHGRIVHCWPVTQKLTREITAKLCDVAYRNAKALKQTGAMEGGYFDLLLQDDVGRELDADILIV